MLDRTNWKLGSQDINYLVLAARVGKITFPLFWIMLDHKGNSDTERRIEILDLFKQAFGFDKILSFSADREFIGCDWFEHLTGNNIPFCIRIKDNQLVNYGTSRKPLKDFFGHLNTDETRHLYTMLDDPRIFIVGKKIKGENLVICSNIHNPKTVLETYKKRWDIESLFRNMKKQGFNLENTHMKDLKRLSKLMALVAITIIFSSIAGITQTCAFKKTVNAPLYSTFTKGLRCLKTQLLFFDFLTHLRLIQKSEG
jgi:hypothetical protein